MTQLNPDDEEMLKKISGEGQPRSDVEFQADMRSWVEDWRRRFPVTTTVELTSEDWESLAFIVEQWMRWETEKVGQAFVSARCAFPHLIEEIGGRQREWGRHASRFQAGLLHRIWKKAQ